MIRDFDTISIDPVLQIPSKYPLNICSAVKHTDFGRCICSQLYLRSWETFNGKLSRASCEDVPALFALLFYLPWMLLSCIQGEEQEEACSFNSF